MEDLMLKSIFENINNYGLNIKQKQINNKVSNLLTKKYKEVNNYLKVRYKDHPIEKKIKRGFSIIIGISMIFMLALLLNLGIVSNKINRLYNGPYSTVDTAWSMKTGLAMIDRYMYRAMLEDDKSRIKKYIEASNNEEELLKQNVQKLRSNFVGDMTLIDDFENNLDIALNS